MPNPSVSCSSMYIRTAREHMSCIRTGSLESPPLPPSLLLTVHAAPRLSRSGAASRAQGVSPTSSPPAAVKLTAYAGHRKLDCSEHSSHETCLGRQVPTPCEVCGGGGRVAFGSSLGFIRASGALPGGARGAATPPRSPPKTRTPRTAVAAHSGSQSAA